MKIIKLAPRRRSRMASAEDIIEQSQRSAMETRLETSPNALDTTEVQAGNYNFVMATVLRQMRQGKMDRTATIDVMFKSHDLFKESYTRVYRRTPSLPAINARGKP
jgi:hypothetical protein